VGEIGPALKKKFTGIVQFDVNDVGMWTLDLKTGDGGLVVEGKGQAKPDLVIKVGDADFASLYDGKSNAQQAFMKGKLKIRGNMSLAMKFNTVSAHLETPTDCWMLVSLSLLLSLTLIYSYDRVGHPAHTISMLERGVGSPKHSGCTPVTAVVRLKNQLQSQLQSINQSINQSISQSTNQLNNQ
jgi:putative sterol carrier protein